MPVIVDTNVAVVANHQNNNVADACMDACVVFLTEVRRNSTVVVIDDGDEVRKEYTRAIQDSKPLQLGALFLVHVIRNQYNPHFVQRVNLEKNDEGEFVDFPATGELAQFDPSDRKFAALARNQNLPVTNATDSDWARFQHLLVANGITVNFLCGDDPYRWFVATNG
jgi:hypothetical protein